MGSTPHVLIADDHSIFRLGLRAVLESSGMVVTEAETTTDALAVAHQEYDAIVVDVVLPTLGGPALVRELLAIRPTARILGLSMLCEPIRVADMIRAGAAGYALKSEPVPQILDAIHRVSSSIWYLSPTIDAVRVKALVGKATPLETLSGRERTVFDLVVRGRTSDQVATTLQIARSTVETHRRNIMQKLDVESTVDLVRVAYQCGAIGTV